MIIRRTDRTFYIVSPEVFMSRSNIGYVGGAIIDSMHSDEGLIALLNKTASVVHQFYYGEAASFASLALVDVWPEEFKINIRGIRTSSSPNPTSRQFNKALFQTLVDESLQICDSMKRTLELPAYQSFFVDIKSLLDNFTKIAEQFQELVTSEIESDKFQQCCSKLTSLICTVLRLSPVQGKKVSFVVHANDILVEAFNRATDLKLRLEKIQHLSTNQAHPISSGRDTIASGTVTSRPISVYYYPIDLSAFRPTNMQEMYYLYRVASGEKSSTDISITDYFSTPEGGFEHLSIEFQTKSVGGVYSEEDLRTFIPICEQSFREGLVVAQEVLGIMQIILATVLEKKAQTLSLTDRKIVNDEVSALRKAAYENGYINTYDPSASVLYRR